MFVVDASVPERVEIGATGVRSVLQQVRMVLTTVRGSVPLDRTFGLSLTFLDRPLPHAMAEYTGEVVAQVQAQVPGVRVERVEFVPDRDGAVDGRLYPVVTVSIEGVEPSASRRETR
ncbi:hypothetical protein [Pseudodesulfovibrio pelocollis]|uniref:hypothetical protein n=1 Tax=Pseudodesulfovibrio pelocollis TaxID=3051432 RepID=UPI00255AB597|nr:hypothetical protein [Pseudodesulfovibrio sp. SB368]